MKNGNQPHILNAASNLIGVCFIIITALKVTKTNNVTYMDEASMVSALFFFSSCTFSYLSLRAKKLSLIFENLADGLFLMGLLTLFISMILFMPIVI